MMGEVEVLAQNNRPYSWQTKQWQHVIDQLRANRLPHAILISGPAGLGKGHFAKLVAQAALCEQLTAAGYPCARCTSCHHYQADSHANYLYIGPEKEAQAIKIQQIRDLIHFLSQTNAHGGRRIIVIEPAEQMTIAAANALLKTLEEPGADSCLLLVSHFPSLLAATIRSRCQQMSFAPVTTEQAIQFFKAQQDVPADTDISLLAKLAFGTPLNLLRALSENQLQQRVLFWQQWHKVLQLAQDPIVAASQLLKMDLLDLIMWLSQWVLDMIRIKFNLNHEQLINIDYQAELINFSKRIHLYALFSYWQYLIMTKRTLLEGINLNKQLVIEDLVCTGYATFKS